MAPSLLEVSRAAKQKIRPPRNSRLWERQEQKLRGHAKEFWIFSVHKMHALSGSNPRTQTLRLLSSRSVFWSISTARRTFLNRRRWKRSSFFTSRTLLGRYRTGEHMRRLQSTLMGHSSGPRGRCKRSHRKVGRRHWLAPAY